jgi:thioredoxin 1
MANFESHINGSKPVVVDFYAEWCGPCKLMTPVLQEVKGRVGERATILKMDVDKNPMYAQQYSIQSVPTLAIFKEGNIVWRKSGVTPAHEILQRLSTMMD